MNFVSVTLQNEIPLNTGTNSTLRQIEVTFFESGTEYYGIFKVHDNELVSGPYELGYFDTTENDWVYDMNCVHEDNFDVLLETVQKEILQ